MKVLVLSLLCLLVTAQAEAKRPAKFSNHTYLTYNFHNNLNSKSDYNPHVLALANKAKNDYKSGKLTEYFSLYHNAKQNDLPIIEEKTEGYSCYDQKTFFTLNHKIVTSVSCYSDSSHNSNKSFYYFVSIDLNMANRATKITYYTHRKNLGYFNDLPASYKPFTQLKHRLLFRTKFLKEVASFRVVMTEKEGEQTINSFAKFKKVFLDSLENGSHDHIFAIMGSYIHQTNLDDRETKKAIELVKQNLYRIPMMNAYHENHFYYVPNDLQNIMIKEYFHRGLYRGNTRSALDVFNDLFINKLISREEYNNFLKGNLFSAIQQFLGNQDTANDLDYSLKPHVAYYVELFNLEEPEDHFKKLNLVINYALASSSALDWIRGLMLKDYVRENKEVVLNVVKRYFLSEADRYNALKLMDFGIDLADQAIYYDFVTSKIFTEEQETLNSSGLLRRFLVETDFSLNENDAAKLDEMVKGVVTSDNTVTYYNTIDNSYLLFKFSKSSKAKTYIFDLLGLSKNIEIFSGSPLTFEAKDIDSSDKENIIEALNDTQETVRYYKPQQALDLIKLLENYKHEQAVILIYLRELNKVAHDAMEYNLDTEYKFYFAYLSDNCFQLPLELLIKGFKSFNRQSSDFKTEYPLNYLELMKNTPSQELQEFLKAELENEKSEVVRQVMKEMIEVK